LKFYGENYFSYGGYLRLAAASCAAPVQRADAKLKVAALLENCLFGTIVKCCDRDRGHDQGFTTGALDEISAATVLCQNFAPAKAPW
jgi:hypothetical protein